MELQRRLASYSGTLIGKRLIRQGSLKKCNRRGHKNDVHIFLVSLTITHIFIADIIQNSVIRVCTMIV